MRAKMGRGKGRSGRKRGSGQKELKSAVKKKKNMEGFGKKRSKEKNS